LDSSSFSFLPSNISFTSFSDHEQTNLFHHQIYLLFLSLISSVTSLQKVVNNSNSSSYLFLDSSPFGLLYPKYINQWKEKETSLLFGHDVPLNTLICNIMTATNIHNFQIVIESKKSSSLNLEKNTDKNFKEKGSSLLSTVLSLSGQSSNTISSSFSLLSNVVCTYKSPFSYYTSLNPSFPINYVSSDKVSTLLSSKIHLHNYHEKVYLNPEETNTLVEIINKFSNLHNFSSSSVDSNAQPVSKAGSNAFIEGFIHNPITSNITSNITSTFSSIGNIVSSKIRKVNLNENKSIKNRDDYLEKSNNTVVINGTHHFSNSHSKTLSSSTKISSSSDNSNPIPSLTNAKVLSTTKSSSKHSSLFRGQSSSFPLLSFIIPEPPNIHHHLPVRPLPSLLYLTRSSPHSNSDLLTFSLISSISSTLFGPTPSPVMKSTWPNSRLLALPPSRSFFFSQYICYIYVISFIVYS
jgi:hypothetical protein